MRQRAFGLLAVIVSAAYAAGCGDNVGAGGPAAAGDMNAAVQIAVVQAPSNLSCLRVTVTGNVTSVQLVSVAPGASTLLMLTGLPTGPVTVHAEGFSTACNAVNNGNTPAWLSNTASATLVAGVTSTIPLTMTPNGMANVQVNFPTPTTTTPPDTTPPTLVSFTPPNGSTNVAETSPVVGTFSEPVSLTSLTSATFTVTDGALPAPGNTTTLGNTAAFAPSPPFGPMQTYTAKISPGIKDLAGNALATGASWTFRTADGAWSTFSQFLGTGNIGQVAVASSRGPGSQTFAVWISNVATGQVFASQFSRTTGWSAPQVIADVFTNGSGFSPQLVVDQAGNATVAWTEFEPAGIERVVAAHFTPVGGWGATAVLDPDGVSPVVAVDGAGIVTAVWTSFGENAVLASQLTAVGWGTPQALQPGFETTAMAITADPAGNVTALWGTSNAMWADRFVPASGWAAPQLINDDGQSPATPSVGADPAGNVIAVWNEDVNNVFRMFANRFVPAVGWGTPQLIDTPSTGGSFGPTLGVDTNGDAVVVYTQGNDTQMSANRFVPATGWGPTQVLVTVPSSDQMFNEVVTVDGAGNALASWNRFTSGIGTGVVVDRFTPATGWGVPQQLIGSSNDIASNPSVTSDGFGRIKLGVVDAPASNVSTSSVVVFQFE